MAYDDKKNTGDICARCSIIYGSCCVAVSGTGSHPTLVSDHEAEMIIDCLKVNDEFFVTEPNTVPFIQLVGSLFPGFSEYTVKAFSPEGTHRSLRVDCFGRCSLLGKEGCLLPHDVRPLFCRIYPFWFINGDLKTFTNERCLAMDQADDPEELMQLFRTDRTRLEALYMMILMSWLGRE